MLDDLLQTLLDRSKHTRGLLILISVGKYSYFFPFDFITCISFIYCFLFLISNKSLAKLPVNVWHIKYLVTKSMPPSQPTPPPHSEVRCPFLRRCWGQHEVKLGSAVDDEAALIFLIDVTTTSRSQEMILKSTNAPKQEASLHCRYFWWLFCITDGNVSFPS